MDNKTESTQHVLKVLCISLFSVHIKQIPTGVFKYGTTYVNTGL